MDKFSLAGLRILHVHTLPIVSGSGINTFLTMQGSRDCGAEPALACAPEGRLQELIRSAGMQFHPIRNFVSELAPLKDLHALWQLDRLLARERFDIVHTHNSKAGFLGRLTARKNRVPIIIHTVHGFAFHEEQNFFYRRLFIVLERAAARWCDRMIVISQPMMDWAQRERIAPPEKLVKIYSGIEVERFRTQPVPAELKKRLGIGSEDTVIGVVSKLWDGKGHEVLMEAVEQLLHRGHRVKLLIVGEGYLEQKLKEKVKRLDIETSVIFTGFWSNVPEITAILDISALPSFYEGMGRVVLEAMAASKPVVATRVGGLTELVEDQVTGYLVPPGDVDVLAERLERLITRPNLRREMGEQGARRVRKEHSAAKMVEMIHEVYRPHPQGQSSRTGFYRVGPELQKEESKLGN
ncbi:glycosyltransferase family 4 protein [Acidobacteria bacterium AH-259-O06]|nr:glycosyltransferase family 4 protein [Acidobacteria bacterium AH-259-O06]